MDLDSLLPRAVAAKTARAMAAGLDLHTVADLLHHYPRRYAERGTLTPLADLVVGEHVTVHARVRSAHARVASTGTELVEAVVTDGTGTLTLTFFGKRQKWRVGQLRPGAEGLFAGQVSVFGRDRVKQLLHPDYQLTDDGDEMAAFAGALLPIYPATTALSSWNIAKAVALVLDLADEVVDPLPAQVRAWHGLVGLPRALRSIHRPADHADARRARHRLRWDEAFVLQVVLAQRRAAARAVPGVPRAPRAGGVLEAFDRALPFQLTDGQRQVAGVLAQELGRPFPMYRLLQGEVGSGKTVVALRAMLAVVDSGGSAALLAPTEVLAQQHARSLRALLGPLAQAGELGGAPVATRVALLTGSLGAAARRTALAEVASGQAGIVVGTHALLSEGVDIADLGLVVVDEQHRFGVEQRDALRAKGEAPHVLVMTATPIPRTVAMTVFGDLEVCTLTELPHGRTPVATFVMGGSGRPMARTWEKVREEAAAGHRAFVVCPRIGGSDDPDAVAAAGSGERADGRRPGAAVVDVLPSLRAGPLAGLRVEALHGRLPADVKEDVMGRFTGGALDVLVATTVVEVGVDVPQATVMVVLDADRFGVSQLHQLRGRVGRGTAPAVCVLVTDVDPDTPAGGRLAAVAATTDGFELSRVDLEQRREGDVLGAAQSGSRSSLRLLRLLRDEDVIVQAREAAVALVEADPGLVDHPTLAAAVAAALDAERADFLEKS